jgi:hypothetical protein
MSAESKIEWIKERLIKIDLLALDFEVGALLAAAKSYKYETVLKPFPTTFLSDSNNDKNYKHLLETMQSLPAVNKWLSELNKFSSEQLSVIYWFLISNDQYYQLKYCTSLTQVLFLLILMKKI